MMSDYLTTYQDELGQWTRLAPPHWLVEAWLDYSEKTGWLGFLPSFREDAAPANGQRPATPSYLMEGITPCSFPTAIGDWPDEDSLMRLLGIIVESRRIKFPRRIGGKLVMPAFKAQSSPSRAGSEFVKILGIACNYCENMMSDFDDNTLRQLDATCARMASCNPVWQMRGNVDFYGLELEGEGLFHNLECMKTDVNWRLRYELFYSTLATFGVPNNSTRVRCTTYEQEFAWCKVQIRPDLMMLDARESVYIEFVVNTNPDFHLALLLAGTSGEESDNEYIRFIPESGYVLRERTPRESTPCTTTPSQERVVDGQACEFLKATFCNAGSQRPFEGLMGVSISHRGIAFYRNIYSRLEVMGTDLSAKGTGVWETTGVVAPLSWFSKSARIAPLVMFTLEGEYDVRINGIASQPPDAIEYAL
eukprot:TRINITY_DN46011_c0_g1_i1.p1 TRINITY_DN46011_c0_g1~~TRINITY_DN46011_c0_g1_i1.p1  ORF type:complete len:481 (+),score=21.33 TRINITY_DN46011_c0_g1_i1:184-1443(+)